MYQGKAYKYRSFGRLDSNVKSRIEQMLVKNECFFARPSSLNDPFDCKPSLQIYAGDLRGYITRLSKKNGLNLSSAQITKTVIDISNEYGDDKFQNKLDDSVSVYCLSQKPTLSTQWAYYGDNHTGFCIEYEINELFGHPAVHVNYEDNRPELNFIRFQKEGAYRLEKMKELATTKRN